jgi:hypothetical protein
MFQMIRGGFQSVISGAACTFYANRFAKKTLSQPFGTAPVSVLLSSLCGISELVALVL